MVAYKSIARLIDAQGEQTVLRSFQCGPTTNKYVLYVGLLHSVGISDFKIRISATLTGATNFKLSLYNQLGSYEDNDKILDNLFDADQALPTDIGEFKYLTLKKNEFNPLQVVMGELGSNSQGSFDLVLTFDSAVTANNVGFDVVFTKHVFIGGQLPDGKTHPDDFLTKASN